MRSMKTPWCLLLGLAFVACTSNATPLPEPIPSDTPTSSQAVLSSPTVTSSSLQENPRPSTPLPTATLNDCAQGWTRLAMGISAKVAGAESDPPSRVRMEPVIDDNIIVQLYPGSVVDVLVGPVCADGLVFWLVSSGDIPTGSGWMAEGDMNEYWLEPVLQSSAPVRLSGYGVSFEVPGNWSNVPLAEQVPAGSDDLCSWPNHVKVTLTVYPAQSEWNPVVIAYRTADKPGWNPMCPGAPLLRMREKTLSLGNRLLFGSTNAQPIFNSELIYYFQGATPDDTYTLYAFLPVNYPLLAYSFQDLYLPEGGVPFDIDHQDWEAYYEAVGAQLDLASDTDFSPSLEILDSLVNSLQVAEP